MEFEKLPTYGDTIMREVMLQNDGDGLLEFSLAPVNQRSWLHLEPTRGVVKAGEKVKVTVRIAIGQEEAREFFMNKQVEEDIVVTTNEPTNTSTPDKSIKV